MAIRKFSDFIGEKKQTVEPKKVEPKKVASKIIFEDSKNTKPSESFKKLTESKIDTLYVVAEQPENSVSIFKYNKKAEVNLSEFSEALINHYRKNQSLNKILENVEIKGNELFSVISNLPDTKFVQIVIKDLIKLIKK